MAPNGPRDIRVDITPDQAVEFLTKLATNEDGVRDRFENDTEALLEEYGISVPAEMLPEEVAAPPVGMLHESLAHLGAAMPNVPFSPLVPPVPFVPFGPVPFAPFSFAYSVVFIALNAARQ